MNGSFSISNTTYRIESTPDGEQYLLAVDQDSSAEHCDTYFDEETQSLMDGYKSNPDSIKNILDSKEKERNGRSFVPFNLDNFSTLNEASTQQVNCYGLEIFNVLFLYSDLFETRRFPGDHDALVMYFNELVESINIVMTNSSQQLRARLVAIRRTDIDSDDPDADDAKDIVEHMLTVSREGEIAVMRHQYNADIVAHLSGNNYGGRAMRSWKIVTYGRTNAGFPEATNRGYGLAHEIGHVLNLEHNREEFSVFERIFLDGKAAYGTRGSSFRTVMSYGNSLERHPYYSHHYDGIYTFPDGELMGGPPFQMAAHYAYNHSGRVQASENILPTIKYVNAPFLSGSHTIVTAKEKIVFKPGFSTANNSTFIASISECLHHAPPSVNTNQRIKNVENIIADSEKKEGSIIYPNPSNGTLNINTKVFKGAENISVKIFDLQGQLVYEWNNIRENILHHSNFLGKDLYIIHIYTPTTRFIEKIYFKMTME